ncbi:CML8 [Symbiodinium sp. CCMP2456]|nr:CML8 [Symbiodinium sp. CCMP2456]
MPVLGHLLLLLYLPAEGTACLAEFSGNPQFQEYSGYAFKVARNEPIPESVQEFFYMKNDPYVVQLTKYARWTHQMLMACWSVEGRVWEVRLSLNESMRAADGTAGLHTAVCAPRSCRPHQVLQQLAIKVITQDLDAVAPTRLQGEVRPLSSWKFLNLRFAIVGMGGCGTTSLQRNIKQHPELRFSRQDDHEETLFAPGYFHEYTGGFRMLPTETQVNYINCGKARCQQNDLDARTKLGLKNYMLHNFDFGLATLSLIDNLVVIAVVCDPLDRLEKAMFWTYCHFKNTTQCSSGHIFDELLQNATVADVVERHREHWVAAERIRVLFTLFERRTIVAHQSLLRDQPQQLYGLLFKKIGVGPPPAGTQYHRYNSVGGERTGLCRRKKILAEFQDDGPKKSAVDKLHDIALEAGCETMLKAWFQFLDTDHSGRIDYTEFDKGLKDMKFTGGPKQTHKLWQELDDDMSGAISFDEFTRPEEAELWRSFSKFVGSTFAGTKDMLRRLQKHHADSNGMEKAVDKALSEQEFCESLAAFGWSGGQEKMFFDAFAMESEHEALCGPCELDILRCFFFFRLCLCAST